MLVFSFGISNVSETKPHWLDIDVLTGSYRIPSGLSYLGYSGLNIEFSKYIYDNSKTTTDFADYSVTSDNFTFTGMIRG